MNADIFALLLKVSVILAAAALVARLLRGSSAARRHFVWSAALTSAIVLVILQWIVPPLIVPVSKHSPFATIAHATLDDPTPSALLSSRVSADASLDEFEQSREALNARMQGMSASATHVRQINSDRNASAVSTNNARGSTANASRHDTLGSAGLQSATTQFANSRETLESIVSNPLGVEASAEPAVVSVLEYLREQLRPLLLGTWFLGSLLMLLRFVLAHLKLRRIAQSAELVTDATLNNELHLAAARLSLHKPVRLLVHRSVSTPCTAGSRNPFVLVPVSFREWNDTRREAVFIHELAHISRGDSSAQNVATLACALFWFHPGFWMAARMLRGESERAADDCVIRSGMAPVDYANHLLAIAQGSSNVHGIPAVALAIAKSSQLELRLRAMLNVQQSRSVFTRSAQRAFASSAFMILIPLASLQARVQEPQPRPKPPTVIPQMTPVTPQRSAKPAVPVPPPATRVPSPAPTAQIRVPPSEPKLAAPVVLPTVGHNVMQLPAAPVIETGPNRGAGIAPLPRRGSVSAPSHLTPSTSRPVAIGWPPTPSQIVVVTPLPSKGVVAPALPPQVGSAPSLPSKGAVVPALSPQVVGAPSLPSKGVVAPALSPQVLIAPPNVDSRTMRPPTPPVRRDTTYEFTIGAQSGDSLIVNIPAGGNVTVHGWDSNSAKLKASIGGKYWRETKVSFRPDRNGIGLFAAPEIGDANFTSVERGDAYYNFLRSPLQSALSKRYIPTTVDNEFEIWVPRKTHVRFTSPIGALTLRDIDGNIDGETKLGALDIENATGKATLVTENGDIRVASSTLSGSLHTGCGALHVSNTGSKLAATTALDPSPSNDPQSANKIIILDGILYTDYCRLKPRVSAERGLDERVPYGPLTFAAAPNGGSLSTRSGDITVDSTGGVLLASTSNANIVIRKMSGDITALNGNGNIDIQVINANSTVHNIWVRSKAGTVTLELPDSLDAEVDVEATYTEEFLEKFKRAARIRDDRSLPQTETAAWYRINSDPLRKAVRSHATLGKGHGRIFIRVTDGDVVLKRLH